MSRTIVWFSCGAASACAAKIATLLCDNVHVVYCDTFAEEHPDNRRFFADIQEWIEQPITVIGSKNYLSVSDVFETTRYMAGIQGARCTVEMKKVPRFEFQQPDDIHVLGLTADEGRRIALFDRNNPELFTRWVLREVGYTKERCLQEIERAGVALPTMYSLGFSNNNCIGCVKATSAKYWNRVRKYFPAQFALRAQQSRDLGVRLVRYQGKRIFLDELPPEADSGIESPIECGVLCTTK